MVDVQIQISKRELVAAVIRTLREAGYTAGTHPDTTRNHVAIFKVADDKVADVIGIVKRTDPGALILHPR